MRERTAEDRRTVIACDHSQKVDNGYSGGCGFVAKLPRCHCRNPKTLDFWSAKECRVSNMWRCNFRKCGFSEQIENITRRTADEERAGDDDDFIASDDDLPSLL